MTRYALFLHGINVGGVRVGMPELREVLTGIGCQDVRTWLNTGNVALDDDRDIATVRVAVEQAVSAAFGYDAHVIVRRADELAGIVAAWPFGSNEGCHRYVVFGGAVAHDDAAAALAAAQTTEAPATTAVEEIAESAHHEPTASTPTDVGLIGGTAPGAAHVDAMPEAIAAVGDDLMWRCPKGISTTSPVAKALAGKHLRPLVTTRNLNTVEKML